MKRRRYSLPVALLTVLTVLPQKGSAEGAASELRAYHRAATTCRGDEAELAAKEGFTRYHEWKDARDGGRPSPKNAFAEAGQAFAHLVKTLGCEDALVNYRYGNLLRHNKSYDEAIRIMKASLPGIREHYPGAEAMVESALGQTCVNAGRHDDAIAHYRRVLVLNPRDAGTRLNLANQLRHRGDNEGARAQARKALALPLSDYGKKVANEILRDTQ